MVPKAKREGRQDKRKPAVPYRNESRGLALTRHMRYQPS
jgi:hypothetical protein